MPSCSSIGHVCFDADCFRGTREPASHARKAADLESGRFRMWHAEPTGVQTESLEMQLRQRAIQMHIAAIHKNVLPRRMRRLRRRQQKNRGRRNL